MSETIAYGALCTWWDDKDNVGKKRIEYTDEFIPTCPHCNRVLMEISKEEWWESINKYESTEPGYTQKVKWSQGKCFANYQELNEAYNAYLLEGDNVTSK